MILWLWPLATAADVLRIATYAAPLTRDGPGLLLRDILRGDDPQVTAHAAIIAQADPDLLVLTDFDYDLDSIALRAFAALFDPPYPYLFAARPNTGMPMGQDIDRNGRLGEPRDAQGYGLFNGQGGMAILSRLPIDAGGVTDLSALLWRDLPGADLPVLDGGPFFAPAVLDVLRLSTTGHWIVPMPRLSRSWPMRPARPPLMGQNGVTSGVTAMNCACGNRCWRGILDRCRMIS